MECEYKDLQYVILNIRNNTEGSEKMDLEQLRFVCKIIHNWTSNVYEASKKTGLGYTED